jgi:large subunit ribosomal protein L17e
MARYAATPANPDTSVKARVESARCSFKNTRETAVAIRGMKVTKAVAYLNDVVEKKQIVPFNRFKRGVGRKAQCKNMRCSNGRWPVKSAELILGLLENIKANATVKGLDIDSLVVSHIVVNNAAEMRRRTYRAHGRVTAYSSNPSHVEIIASQDAPTIPAAEGAKAARSVVQA